MIESVRVENKMLNGFKSNGTRLSKRQQVWIIISFIEVFWQSISNIFQLSASTLSSPTTQLGLRQNGEETVQIWVIYDRLYPSKKAKHPLTSFSSSSLLSFSESWIVKVDRKQHKLCTACGRIPWIVRAPSVKIYQGCKRTFSCQKWRPLFSFYLNLID